MALVSFVQARLEVLVVNVATGVGKDSEVFTTMQASTVEAIEKTCSEVVGGIPESQVSQLLHAIAEAPITEDQRARLRITFNNLLSEAGPLKRLQTVHAPEEFLPKELWDTLRCPTECVPNKLAYLAGFWHKLGLRSPSEPTARDIAAIALMSEPVHVSAGKAGVEHVRCFKRLLKDMAAHSVEHRTGPSTFYGPEAFANNFPALYEKAYAPGPPARCPKDCAARIQVVRGRLGCRSSKSGCGGDLAAAKSKPTADFHAFLTNALRGASATYNPMAAGSVQFA